MLHVEDARIAEHLRGAEELLRQRDVSHLPLPVRRVRDHVIDALAAYRRAERFPRNHAREDMTPVFIDDHGTRCAMAHLLELVGARELVERVARGNNLARIRELAADRELLLWLSAMGLTVAEAARIQPSYCFYKRAHCWCNYSDPTPPDAVVTATYVGPADSGRSLYRVDGVHGGSGVTIGETLELSVAYATAAPSGTVRVLAIHRSDAGVSAAPVPKDYIPDGNCVEIAKNIPITTEEATTALLSTTCTANLIAKDPRLDESVCLPFDGGVPGSDTSVPFDAMPDTMVTDGVMPDAMVADSGAFAVDTGSLQYDAGHALDGAATLDDPASDALAGRSCAFGQAAAGVAPLAIMFSAAVLVRRRWS